jgi:hypothetical protein
MLDIFEVKASHSRDAVYDSHLTKYRVSLRASRSKAMKKISFIFLAMGLGILLISSGASAVSIGLVDGDGGGVTLDFISFAPGYNFGYIDNRVFHSIVAPGVFGGTATQEFKGVSTVNFALQALFNPLSIFEAAQVYWYGEVAPNVFHTATLNFSSIPLDVTFTAARNSPPDGLTPVAPNPEPATLLLLGSVIAVGCGTLYKKISNREERHTVNTL